MPQTKILFTISDFVGGGAEREMAVLLKYLSRERFEPHVCIWRPVFEYALPDDVPRHVLDKTKPWHVVRTIRRFARLIDEIRPAAVFSQLHYVNMVTGTALRLSRHQPGWVCRQVMDPTKDMRGAFATWARWSLRRAEFATGCCDAVSRELVRYLRLHNERVRTLVNMVDVPEIERLAAEPPPLEKRPGVFTVIHAGRLAPVKNQAMLLEAFSRFRGRPAELWMLKLG